VKYIVAILFFMVLGVADATAQKPVATPVSAQKTIVKFFPNPAVNFITFEMKEPVERGSSLQVYSFLGRQVASVPVNAQRVTVNVSDYFRGIYVFQLRSPNGKVVETNKFQVSR
jgi:Secretion system C-terminal sorting domain